MSYKSILVNLDIDGSPQAIVKLAVDLASRFQARLIGVAAADVPPPVVSVDGMVSDGGWMQIQYDEIESRLRELQREFQRLVGGAVEAEWRGAVFNPTRFLIDSARAADLVVTASHGGNRYRAVDVGSLALGAGRPVLVAAGATERIAANRILVAWKDTREARRAVADALPFLIGADEVVVATVSPDPDMSIRDSLADVAAFLARHGVKTRTEVLKESVDADSLIAFGRSIGAELTVSGAYGHSRLREWAFGGVTRTLLDDGGLNRFLAY